MPGAACESRDRRSELRRFSASLSMGRRHSRIKVLLPEPLTPETRTNRPKGKATVRFLRLFFVTLWRASHAEAWGLQASEFWLLDFVFSTEGGRIGRLCPLVGYFLRDRRHF